MLSLLMLFLQQYYYGVLFSDIYILANGIMKQPLYVIAVMQLLNAQERGSENDGTIFLTPPLVVKAQEVDNFNCTFSECAGENIVCYCSVPNDPLFWWDGNSCITITYDSNPTRDEPNVVAEVVATSPSGGFTSKLTRRNISTELNGTEIGCFQPQNDCTCNSSCASQNFTFMLNVQSCQGKA